MADGVESPCLSEKPGLNSWRLEQRPLGTDGNQGRVPRIGQLARQARRRNRRPSHQCDEQNYRENGREENNHRPMTGAEPPNHRARSLWAFRSRDGTPFATRQAR